MDWLLKRSFPKTFGWRKAKESWSRSSLMLLKRLVKHVGRSFWLHNLKQLLHKLHASSCLQQPRHSFKLYFNTSSSNTNIQAPHTTGGGFNSWPFPCFTSSGSSDNVLTYLTVWLKLVHQSVTAWWVTAEWACIICSAMDARYLATISWFQQSYSSKVLGADPATDT